MSASMLPSSHFAASAVTAIAVNALWEDALLVVCVWLLLRAWPSINAATRYIVWSATLIATVVVPVATTLPFLTPSSPATAVTATGGEGAHSHGDACPHRRSAAAPETGGVPLANPAVAPAKHAGAIRRPASAIPERFRMTLPLPLALGRARDLGALALAPFAAAGDRARASGAAQARRASACRSSTATRWPAGRQSIKVRAKCGCASATKSTCRSRSGSSIR